MKTSSSKPDGDSTELLCQTLAYILEELVRLYETSLPHAVDRYCSSSPPKITIEDYLKRLVKYVPDEKNVYIAMLIYLDRYLEKDSCRSLNKFNVHRLIACALLSANKQLQDHGIENAFFRQVAGVTLRELNFLELKFYQDLDYKLFITLEEFVPYYEKLEQYSNQLSEAQNKSRSWGL